MGIVIRQSFWTSVITYIGVAVGYVNSLILFPAFLSTEQIGLIRQLQAAALLLVPVASLGISATTVKFHPEFASGKRSSKEFFTLMLSGAVIGFLLNLALILVFKSELISFFQKKSELVNDYFYVIILLLLFLTVSAVFESYLRARFNIVFNNLVNGVVIRVMVGLSVILYGSHLIGFEFTVNSLIAIYGLAMLLISIYAFKTDPFSIKFPFTEIGPARISGIANYSFYSILGTAGNVILLNIDILMVTGLAGLSQTGIYTTAFYIGLVIEMPRRAISQISIPVISAALNKGEFEVVKNHYKRVSINQIIIGGLLFLGIIANLDNIYNLIPNKENFIAGMPVVVIIGIAKLIDMAFSQNSEILMLSKHYRLNVITVLILGFFTVLFNYLLIPEYGIIGAGFASLAAIALFNIVKLILIKVKLGFQPFSWHTAYLVAWIAAVYYLSTLLPFLGNVFLDILIRSTAITVLFTGPIYMLNISPEINETIRNLLLRFRG